MDKVSVTAWKCTHNKLERELKEDDNDENIDDDGYLLLAFRVPENINKIIYLSSSSQLCAVDVVIVTLKMRKLRLRGTNKLA